MTEQTRRDEGPGIVEVVAQKEASPAGVERALKRERNIMIKVKALRVATIGLALGSGGVAGLMAGKLSMANFATIKNMEECGPGLSCTYFYMIGVPWWIAAGVSLLAGAVAASSVENKITADSLVRGLVRPEKL